MALPEMRLLQAAIALAEELNFSRAADRLRFTQPALSKQIFELESQLGFRLFERNHQSVQLTDAGRAFVQEAREAVIHTERAIVLAKAAFNGADEVLNIGRSSSTDPFLITTLLSVRLPLYPGMRINFSSNFSNELARQVISGNLDLAIVTGVPDSPRLSPLLIAESVFYVAMPVSDELSHRRSVALNQMSQRNWVLFARHMSPYLYDEIQNIASEGDIRPSDTHHIMAAEEAIELILEHSGLAVLTRDEAWRIARDGITIRPLREDRLRLATNLVARADTKSRLVAEFVRATSKKLKSVRGATQQRLAFANEANRRC